VAALAERHADLGARLQVVCLDASVLPQTTQRSP
jgi:hypothetical protein